MSLAIQLAIAGILLVAGFGGGVKFHAGLIAQRDLAARVEQERETLRRIDKVDTSAVKHEVAKTRIETEFVTITERVNHETEKLVYRNVCLPDDSLRIIADAINGTASAPSVPASALRKPATTN